MPYTKHVGSLLDVEEGIIVHGCNCHGVMGGGIAYAIRKKWPEVFEAYYAQYKDEVGLELGDINIVVGSAYEHLFTEDEKLNGTIGVTFSEQLPPKLIVVNAMTQKDLANGPDDVVADYDAISMVFEWVAVLASSLGQGSNLPVHFPLIGCGLANGKWSEVAPRIEAALGIEIESNLWVLEDINENA